MTLPPPFRAEHIGSLLRPAKLLHAREQHAAGRLDQDGLTAIENEAIRRVVRLQEEVGLEVITDGEFRRGTYSDAFTSAGLSGVDVELTEPVGWTASETHGHRMARRIPKVVDRIEWKGPRNAGDFRFLKSLTRRTPKFTLPGPCYIHYRAGRRNISRDVYPDLDKFWADLATAYLKEMHSLAEAGCSYLQIDETSLVKLGDPRVRELLKERGDDWRDLLRIYIGVVNAVVARAPEGMTVGIHICRSQDPSWQADVGYDAVARPLFNDMNVDIYFLEYDNIRTGTLLPLRWVPDGKFVVLGLVASNVDQVETAEYLERRIAEASRYLKLEQLCLSPQCGFSTSAAAHRTVTEEIEKAKLARIVEVARAVWGTA
ncbi:MAG TPA: 5-methyltetrahydropteroyltriglutamate--homocysteine S-methyltransferase [Xanthobacteraceae bacterium]|nr:5-methyltetrahydropteroyltriglutamate--homocysteine S-methyltransferase [Xanthobacteraceae bacterium]